MAESIMRNEARNRCIYLGTVTARSVIIQEDRTKVRMYAAAIAASSITKTCGMEKEDLIKCIDAVWDNARPEKGLGGI